MNHQRTVSSILTSVLLALPVANSQEQLQLRVGDPAPDFTLPYATRDSINFEGLTLSERIGTKYIILAFYPADWSGGCTKEVCAMRDSFSDLEKLDAEVLGISGDYVFSHHEWAKYLNLPFALLSDHQHEVARLYNSYDKTWGFNKRTVFVVDKEGKIAYVNMKYDVSKSEDFKLLLSKIAELR